MRNAGLMQNVLSYQRINCWTTFTSRQPGTALVFWLWSSCWSEALSSVQA